MSKPPFDLTRATFYLVAGVFGLYGALLILALVLCLVGVEKYSVGQCFAEGRLTEALSTLLASALAFAGGRSSPK